MRSRFEGPGGHAFSGAAAEDKSLPTRTWMWPPRTDAPRTSAIDSIAVHGWASMSEPPSRQASRASGVRTVAHPTCCYGSLAPLWGRVTPTILFRKRWCGRGC